MNTTTQSHVGSLIRGRSGDRSQRGAVMMEFTLLLPLFLVFLGLIFYMGMTMTRAGRASQAARYETWRDVAWRYLDWHDVNWNARTASTPKWPEYFDTGPSYDAGPGGEELMNREFYNGRTSFFDRTQRDTYFPPELFDEMIRVAGEKNPDGMATTMMSSFLYKPSGEPRFSRGERQVFEAAHADSLDLWQRIGRVMGGNGTDDRNAEMAVRRGHIRIADEWRFIHDWTASHPMWSTFGSIIPGEVRQNSDKLADPHRTMHQMRAVRDAFFMDFDADIDAIDGENNDEYTDVAGGPQVPGDNLSGVIRGLYLNPPGYRGPIVGSE